jgi:hypothetical protein
VETGVDDAKVFLGSRLRLRARQKRCAFGLYETKNWGESHA